jgi:hypothetical protein
MAVAEYFGRAALAASQVLSGFSPEAFRSRLDLTAVSVAFGEDAVSSAEGRALLDMSVRLLARLYPTVRIRSAANEQVLRLQDLAREINPRIDLEFEGPATHEMLVGRDVTSESRWSAYLGSDGWNAYVSTATNRAVGRTTNAIGAGAAAALGCATLFRQVFLESDGDADVDLDTWALVADESAPSALPHEQDLGVLAGAGAIGNAALWALDQSGVRGSFHVVDPQTIESSNLQRYVLATQRDIGRPKVEVAARSVQSLTLVAHERSWAEFVSTKGYGWRKVLLALDSARDRRSAQASLPSRTANAWTQIGDLGVSIHDFLQGACVCCLYLPEGATPNQDQVVATALAVPEKVAQIRDLLYRAEAVPDDLLQLIADRLGLNSDALEGFRGRPIRNLYVEGICGGGLVPLGSRVPGSDMQVPLAHQSALAGILLAAAWVALSRTDTGGSWVSRIDVMHPLGEIRRQPLQKDPRGLCICQDADYVSAYQKKWPEGEVSSEDSSSIPAQTSS